MTDEIDGIIEVEQSGLSRFGYVAIVGQPNVGKSTLLNHLLGVKLSITADKQQTTRHQILGVNTLGATQIAYIDTPGLHLKETKAMNTYLNRSARAAIFDVDLILFVVSALTFDKQDENVLSLIKKAERPTICVVNKVDQVKDKGRLLPYLESLSEKYAFETIFPLSAFDSFQVKEFEKTLFAYLPEGKHQFEDGTLTDRSDSFIASEILREKLTRYLSQELPYSLTVTIDLLTETEELLKIHATIWVEKQSQKPILLGAKGERMKKMATEARLDMETFFEKKVFLQCWVKVKDSWADSKVALDQLGYN
jgi:GTP-binding protein Era